jgi:nitrogen fixation NifU-like protein
MDFKNIYNNQLYERYNHPHHKVILKDFSHESGVYNPSCGDKVSLQVELVDGIVKVAGFQAEGCVISGGSADLLLGYMLGKHIADAQSLTKDDIFTIIGMPLGPNRLRCAFITVEALQNIAQKHQEQGA